MFLFSLCPEIFPKAGFRSIYSNNFAGRYAYLIRCTPKFLQILLARISLIACSGLDYATMNVAHPHKANSNPDRADA